MAEAAPTPAEKFDAPTTLLVDNDNAVAHRLGIQQPGGVVRFAPETDNDRVRPDPVPFLDALDRPAAV